MRILTGDCRDVLPTLDAESVDAVVCDPPYELGFMGKQWDRSGVAFQPATWEAVRRVAKPGAHLVAFGGSRTFHRLTCAIEDAGWEIRDCLSYLYGSGFPKSHNGPWGGTALKPAWEPIILARKPLVGTVAANVTEHGTGALNIDACRVAAMARPARVSLGENTSGKNTYGDNGPGGGSKAVGTTDLGRWPANVVLDEDAARLLDEQAPDTGAAAAAPGPTLRGETSGTVACGARKGLDGDPAFHGDRGGASRFFYTAKASRSERNAGLTGDKKPLLWSAGTQNPGSFQSANTDRSARNHHPTVKPLDLMRWLCRLVTPPGGVILDSFAGSGTTGCAAALEGFDAILIEREAEFAEIARARVAHYRLLYQPTLFAEVSHG